MEQPTEEFHPYAHQNRSVRRRLVFISVIVTFFLGFCVVPWVLFGGMTIVEDLFRGLPTEEVHAPSEEVQSPQDFD